MYPINQQDAKTQNKKTYPAVFAALAMRAHGVLRQGASGGVAARVHALLQTHEAGREGQRGEGRGGGSGGCHLFTTCGPDQHTGVHLSTGSTQIKTFRSRGVHFLSTGSFPLGSVATFETQQSYAFPVSHVSDLEIDSLPLKKT